MNIELTLKVQDLNARYVEAIDANKLEAWPDFFTEDGRYRVTTAENEERALPLAMIYATSRAMLRDRVRSLRDANVYEAQRYRHIIGAPLIHSASEDARERADVASEDARERADVASEDARERADVGKDGAVEAQTSFIVARVMHTGETTLFATGTYHDRVVIHDGVARFAEKAVILDSRLIDTLLAIPL
jgi:anthranilate 1,2-dioxygenase small subunit/terephthalate 1,2-dioxygenase oxygenase component beta subunit